MSKVIIGGVGGGGAGSDECTARLSDVPAGLKAVTADSGDEAGVGTMALTGNAQAGHVLAGETFYTNDYKTRQTGAMTVGSLLSFSVAAYSGKRVLAKWQNPNQAAGKPYSGVIIRYSTGGYPGTGGTQIYKGAGNNTAAGGWSQAFLDMPALNTTYYFSCTPYVTCSAGEMLGAPINFTCATGADLWLTFTAGQNYTVPEGYTLMDTFAVGGGGGGGGGTYSGSNESGMSGGGGGGGYTTTVNAINISPGEILSITVGGGGSGGGVTDGYYPTGQPGNSGGESSIVRSGATLITASGGKSNNRNAASNGSDGGSGGARSGVGYSHSNYRGLNGGADGSDSEKFVLDYNGKGQGQTTRAYGDPNGTLYSGGGGSGSSGARWAVGGGSGGSGGGGFGGLGWYVDTSHSEAIYYGATGGGPGGTNTGGGGGGGGAGNYFTRPEPGAPGGPGGSGIVLLHLY